jgi:hypothetical protein
MMPSLRKSTTLEQTDTWLKERRLLLHHAGLAHLVEMVNKFASEDKHVLCADGQVLMSMYLVCTSTYMVHTLHCQYIPCMYLYVPCMY